MSEGRAHYEGALGWPAEQPTLIGTELTLRPWRPDDADSVFTACQDPDIQRFTTVPVPYRVEHARGFVSEVAPQQWEGRLGAAFCVTDRTDAVLGACGLVAVDRARAGGEVGYWIAPSARRRGLAPLAIRLLADWALTEGSLARLELYIEPANTASITAAERAGCEREGLLRKKALVAGERRDMLLYSLVA